MVLVLLMALPTITYSNYDASHIWGLQMLFWFGRSNCNAIDGEFYCEAKKWMS